MRGVTMFFGGMALIAGLWGRWEPGSEWCALASQVLGTTWIVSAISSLVAESRGVRGHEAAAALQSLSYIEQRTHVMERLNAVMSAFTMVWIAGTINMAFMFLYKPLGVLGPLTGIALGIQHGQRMAKVYLDETTAGESYGESKGG